MITEKEIGLFAYNTNGDATIPYTMFSSLPTSSFLKSTKISPHGDINDNYGLDISEMSVSILDTYPYASPVTQFNRVVSSNINIYTQSREHNKNYGGISKLIITGENFYAFS